MSTITKEGLAFLVFSHSQAVAWKGPKTACICHEAWFGVRKSTVTDSRNDDSDEKTVESVRLKSAVYSEAEINSALGAEDVYKGFWLEDSDATVPPERKLVSSCII